MQKQINLSSGNIFDIDYHFPQITPGDKVAIMFTGGVDSYLVALIARELYGNDNIVYVLNTADMYSNFRSDPQKLHKVTQDFYKGVNRLGGIHTYEITAESFRSGRYAFDNVKQDIGEQYSNIKYAFTGFSNLHGENIRLLIDCEWRYKTIEDVYKYYAVNKDNYPELKMFIEEIGGKFYFVDDPTGFDSVLYTLYHMRNPLLDLTKYEVMEVYKMLGWEDELAQTTSCSIGRYSDTHCGRCKNCLYRKWAYAKAGIEDKTEYVK